MKKGLLLGLAILPLALASCGNCKNGSCNASGVTGNGDKEELYAGIIPSADAEGFLYTLRLDYDDDHNFTDGDFAMTQTAIMGDSVGYKAGIASYTEGDFFIESKNVNGVNTKYMRLVPDAKESLGTADNSVAYMLVNDDNSLTLVNADLTKAESDSLNYTLTLK